jgi:predicted O-methyltransferase YrrM
MAGSLSSQISYAAQVGRAMIRDPFEGKERILERVDEWRSRGRPPPQLAVDSTWEERLHVALEAHWPCSELEEFSELWTEIVQRLQAEGLDLGRGAFGGWDDADSALARAAWCITCHTQPQTVLETGVGRGITTRVILEALRRNSDGRLFSIDLPPLLELDLHRETAAAVPEDLRGRWTLVRGSSRGRLQDLLKEIVDVDFFLHDSMHTTRNVMFELGSVWPHLRAGGFVLIDDIERNAGFSSFVHQQPRVTFRSVIPADDGRALVGLIQKRVRER